MITEKVTIGVVNYNGMDVLPETLRAILNLGYPDFDVIVVDNASTDGSRVWVQEHFPHVRCICLNSNRGLPGARNVILNEANTDYVLIMDNDIVLEPDVLTHLMCIIKTVPRAAVCHPELRDANDPVVHHYNGGWVHYLCALVSRPKPDLDQERPVYEIFDAISGAALLIDRQVALKVGGFDKDFFFNMEDGDFSSRVTLAGYYCLNIPGAVAHHRSKPRGTSKVFYQTRNRWFFILKLYSWRTLILTSPMFLIFEFSQALFLLVKGAIIDYWKGNLAMLQNLPMILQKRRAFQRLKVKRDRDWLKAGELYVPEQLLTNKLLRVFKRGYDSFFALYWKAVQPFC